MPDGASAPFYDDLGLSLAEACRLISHGAVDRKVAAHHPVVATIGADGVPSQRIMILRAVDWQQRRLRFHTDRRTAKAGELAASSAASVLFYEPDPKIQLRLSGKADISTDGVEADAAWHQSTNFARRCYLADPGPGTCSPVPISGLPAAIEGRQPDDAEILPGRTNFAILLLEFDSIEWLYLANSGHRRARWDWDSAGDGWTGNWLVP